MHEHGTVRRGGAAFIWKWGAICGAVLGAIQIIISLLSPGSLKTIIDVLVWLVAFFVIGLFAARQTGRVTTGALVGLVGRESLARCITHDRRRSHRSQPDRDPRLRARSGSGPRRSGRSGWTASCQASHIHPRCRSGMDPTVPSLASFTGQTSSLGFPPEPRVRGAGDSHGSSAGHSHGRSSH